MKIVRFTMPDKSGVDISGLKEFKLHVDRWATYMTRVKAWFTINDIKPADQSKYLVAVVGTEALDLIIDLCYPEKPEKTEIGIIEKLVEEHLTPKRSKIAERMIFRSCKQVEGQSISEYLAQLKKLSKACKFSNSDSLKENLRDQFVFGLFSERIRQRIMTEKDDELTFARTTELALSLETVIRDSGSAAEAGQPRGGSGTGAGADAVFAVNRAGASGGGGGSRDARSRGARRRWPQEQGRAGGSSARDAGAGDASQQRCFRCDGWHSADSCSFIRSECYVCGRKGHIAKVCSKRKNRAVYGVTGDSSSDSAASESEDDCAVSIYKLSDDEGDEKWHVKVKVNNVPLLMEVDTGSSISVISYGTYSKYFAKSKLQNYESNLKMYSGQRVKPKGKFTCFAEINGRVISELNLIVIDNEYSPSLLGRDWMRSFNIGFPRQAPVYNIQLNTPASSDEAVTKSRKSFPDVSEEGIGTFNMCTIEMEVNPGAAAVPVWRRARFVPLALRPAVDAELERLQCEGIISPVEWSEWGTPVVPVIKKSGQEDSRLSTTQTSDSDSDHSDGDIDIVGETHVYYPSGNT